MNRVIYGNQYFTLVVFFKIKSFLSVIRSSSISLFNAKNLILVMFRYAPLCLDTLTLLLHFRLAF